MICARPRGSARGFYRMLDTMLFRAAEPGERYRVLERFYGLDAKLIARFYASRSTLARQGARAGRAAADADRPSRCAALWASGR